MPDYTHQAHVDAPAQDLFDYLAQVRNLPDYFPIMTRAEPAEKGEAVETTANLHGRPVESEAWFHVDSEKKTLRWGSEGDNDYHGELSVTAEQTGSTVTVSLHTERVASDEIDQGLRQTLTNIKQLVETETTA